MSAEMLEVLAGTRPWWVAEGDCLDVLKGLPDACVDAVVTDPPYGVRDEDWDRMSPQEFARFSMSWLSVVRRVCGELVVFCSAYGPFRAICEMLYPRIQVMFWDKPWGSQYAGASECGLWYAHETILHGYTPVRREYVTPKVSEVGRLISQARTAAGLSRGGVDIAVRGRKTGLCYRWEEGACLPTPEQAEQLRAALRLDNEFADALAAAYAERDETVGRARQGASEHAARGRDVFSYHTVAGEHPCQKPVGLMVELVERLTPPGGLVLDPFAGSGATGVACRITGRRFLGVELSPEYAALARRRVAAETPLLDQAGPGCGPPLTPAPRPPEKPPEPSLFDAVPGETP